MQSFTRFCAIVVIAMGALAACGNSQPDNGSGTATNVSLAGVNLVGTLDGKTYLWKDVASAVVMAGSSQTLVLVVSDANGVCTAIGAGNATDSNLLVVRITESSGTVAVGSHQITSATQASGGGEKVTVSLESPGSILAATGGDVAVSYVALDNSSPAVLVVTATDGGNTLSGSLNAPACAALEKNVAAY